MVNKAVDLAAALCRAFEGFSSKPYLCPANVPTIGFGSTFYPGGRKVALDDPSITREQAEEMLKLELLAIVPKVAELCPTVIGNDKRTAALIDFCYNLGWPRLRASTLRRKVAAKDWGGACTELLKWDKAGGKVLPGLTKRRHAEALLLRGA